MSGSKPKKGASKKSAPKAAPKAAPSTKAKAPAKEPSPKAAAVDGVELGRRRRLARHGFEGADRCDLLGVPIDVGPRARPWYRAVRAGGAGVGVLSELGVCILASGVSPKDLELAAARLRELQVEKDETP